MPSRHGDEKLIGAYSPPAFVEAIDAVARATGRSRSVLIRAALLNAALGTDPDSPDPKPRKEVT